MMVKRLGMMGTGDVRSGLMVHISDMNRLFMVGRSLVQIVMRISHDGHWSVVSDSMLRMNTRMRVNLLANSVVVNFRRNVVLDGSSLVMS